MTRLPALTRPLPTAGGTDPMTSTARMSLFEHANDRGVTLKSVSNGSRTWTGQMQDAEQPGRAPLSFSGDVKHVTERISAYAKARQRWVANNPILGYPQAVAGNLIPPGPAPAPEEPVAKLVYVPDDEAIEAAFNEGLTEGRNLAMATLAVAAPAATNGATAEISLGAVAIGATALQQELATTTALLHQTQREHTSLGAALKAAIAEAKVWKDTAHGITKRAEAAEEAVARRDKALLHLRRRLTEDMSRLEASGRIQELLGRDLERDVATVLAAHRQAATSVNKHKEHQLHLENGLDVWQKTADEYLDNCGLTRNARGQIEEKTP